MRFALALMLAIGLPSLAIADDFQNLFNGKDLTGWKGLEGHWSVKDGKIVGTSVGKPIKGNTFLVWQDGKLADFELVAEIRAEGNNSGIQYRSETVGTPDVLKGYQCDIHPAPEYLGMMYDEKRRGIIATRGQKGTLPAGGKLKVTREMPKTPQFEAEEFNTYRVIGVDNRLIHQVNGVTTIDVTDDQPEATAQGVLGLQLHAGPEMTVEIKSVKYRPLSKEDGAKVLDEVAKAETKTAAAKPAARGQKPADFVSKDPQPNWIWADENPDAVQFRHELELTGKPVSTQLYVSCDNIVTLFINGKKVATSDEWQTPTTKDVKSFLKSGKNLITADCKNEEGVAAFVFKLSVKTDDGKTAMLVSDKTWLHHIGGGNDLNKETVAANWGKPSREMGLIGREPWGIPGSDSGSNEPYAEEIETLAGFKVERIYDVPKDEQGSWVALSSDGKDGLIASDERDKGMYHITFTATGEPVVEKLPVDISGAQGLNMHEGSLYFNRHPEGLHRAYDSNGDGKLDKVEKLPSATGAGEHGTHAIIDTLDKQGFFTVAGNFCTPPSEIARYHVKAYGEDELFPRNWDPRGHARGLLAPGGFVTKYDVKSKTYEMYSVGYRNTYDIATNRFGDLFGYDSDMEWDFGMPWYRPTRVVHATSGSDFGWRSGSLNNPDYYEDTLPAILDIGPGSPTGVVHGAGLKFPTRYQDALLILDWTFGTIYAVHLEPDGSSYKATHEAFLNASPLPVTDAVVGKDGNLYFTTGGRGSTSALYKVSYVGTEDTSAPKSQLPADSKKARDQRLALEKYHGVVDAAAIDAAWPLLADTDRVLRYTARVAIEAQPIEQWASKVTTENRPQAQITAAIALARVGSKEHQSMVYGTLLKLNPKSLDVMQALGLLRAYDIAFCRIGLPEAKTRNAIIAQIEPMVDDINADGRIQAEVIKLLVALNAPGIAQKGVSILTERQRPQLEKWKVRLENNNHYGSTVQQMFKNPPDIFGLRLAYYLKNQKTGWTLSQRRAFLTFLNSQAKMSGGASYPGYMELIRNDFLGNTTNEVRASLADLSGESFQPQPDFAITQPKGPGREWTIPEAMGAISKAGMNKANFESGRNLYFATTCGKCHRFAGLGGDVGPDLTTISNKFDAKYVLESIIEPSKNISDQYQSTTVVLTNGKQYTGLVVERDGKFVIHPSDANAPEIVVTADEIEVKEPSPISQMPEKLINNLSPEELRDLTAYLMSAGDPKSDYYKQKK